VSITNQNLTLRINIVLVKLDLQIGITYFFYYITWTQHSECL